MTTSDAVEQSGDAVTVHVTEDGKLYYEGTMDAATALPLSLIHICWTKPSAR